MNYLQWNNAIGKFYFNQDKAEQEVFLFITRNDIINIGKNGGLVGSDAYIFQNFIDALRSGNVGRSSSPNMLQMALDVYNAWKNLKDVGTVNDNELYPLYINYLALFVLPLTENQTINVRSNAYYPLINSFLNRYDLPRMPYQNELLNWNLLWKDLEEWSIIEKNTELGYFELHPFTNTNWIYVGKPLSQCIFPIYAIRKLPLFFEYTGLVPGEKIDNKTFIRLLLLHGRRYLGLSNYLLKLLRDPDNELGQSVLGIVKKNYQDWTGSTDHYDADNETIKKGNTIAQLRMCIEGDRVRGYRSYYRLYTNLDFPEDLIFKYNDGDYKCQQFGKGWSKPIMLPFCEGMELQDDLNKWKAKFPEKDVRLLVDGRNFHMSGWVEVPYMVTSKMLLLAKEKKSSSIEEWGHCFSKGDFKEISEVGIPSGHKLYEFCNPPFGHPDIPVLQFQADMRLIIMGGLKIGVRTWLIDLLPDVVLENGRGTENVYLIYEDGDAKLSLERTDFDQPIWKLPPDINTNRGFYIKVEGEDVNGEQLKNYIVDTFGKANVISEEVLPARDKFGQVVDKNLNPTYVVGSNLRAEDERRLRLRQAQYSFEFTPQETNSFYNPPASNDMNTYNDLLVTYLTVKGESNAKDYYEAFESVYQKRFGPDEIESHSIELSRLKRWSINYLDFMGILDYEYSTKKIVVNPPQFLLIPTKSGRKVLLIGGRTSELLQKIEVEAKKEGLFLILEQQDPSLIPFILPPTVTLLGFDKCNGNRIISKFRNVADSCSISFDPDKYPQFRLAEYSASIAEYVNQLIPDERFDDSGWIARVFDPASLNFVPSLSEGFDKSYSLVEYRLTEYNFKHRFWKNGLSHPINKNWGRYMILNHNRRGVIFNDREKKIVAIPATLPLPRLISEAMTLFSGRAPKRLYLEIEGIKTWFNIYENIPSVFAYNYFMKVGQRQLETTIQI